MVSIPRLGTTDHVHLRRLELLRWLDDEKFEKPMELGATDSSHHSSDLRFLASKGLVEIGGYRSYLRRVNKYRRTPAGKRFLRLYEDDRDG
ncbi:MAG: hypothetical protein AMJ72_05420 [Acidithiobacillales bacterium SM1_46]|nr:MAG: hypothetical protein AMJ72_05420 [Acidithiobacillales bacterium SM1_46]